MGNGCSQFYESLNQTLCAKHETTVTDEMRGELLSSIGNKKHAVITNYLSKHNKPIDETKKTQEPVWEHANSNNNDEIDKKEMTSLHIWSSRLNKALSVYEEDIERKNSNRHENVSERKQLEPLYNTYSPIPSNVSTITSIAITDIDLEPTPDPLSFQESILFSDYNELLINGFLRMLNTTTKWIISNINPIIRNYSVPNWSDLTNISVYIRVKPYIITEIDVMFAEENDENEISSNSITIDDNMITIHQNSNPLTLTGKYNGIFDYKTSQRHIYLQTAAPLMQACVDGFNVTIFAYGPAECFKSYTIFGSNVEFGIAQRCIATLAYQLNQKREHMCGKIDAFKFLLSGLRISNKKLYDLFDTTDTDKLLFIKPGEEERSCPFVEGLVELNAMSLENAFKAIYNFIVEKNFNDFGNDIILFVKMEQFINNMDGSETRIQSELKLVKCKASKSIRTVNDFDMYDLLEQRNCLSKKMYKETPFNYLMSGSFGGNCITTMIGCISSDIINVQKAVNTLKFASAVINARNIPRANVNECWDIYIQPQMPMSASFQLTVDPKKTFREIKWIISKIINMDEKRIVLMWDGICLNNDQVLCDSKVPKKAVIYLSKKIKDMQLCVGVGGGDGVNIGVTNLTFSTTNIWTLSSTNDQ